MQSLKTKIVELREEIAKAKRRDKGAAVSRCTRVLREAFGDDLENSVQGLSDRLLNETATAADQRVLDAMPGADLKLLNTTAERHVVLLATVFSKY